MEKKRIIGLALAAVIVVGLTGLVLAIVAIGGQLTLGFGSLWPVVIVGA